VKKQAKKEIHKAEKALCRAEEKCHNKKKIKAAKKNLKAIEKKWRTQLATAKSNLKKAKAALRTASKADNAATKQLEAIVKALFYNQTTDSYYLTLIQENYSIDVQKQHLTKPGDSSITTKWSKIRVDPCTLKVHTGDYTYSSSTGRDSHYSFSLYTVAYGTARDCEAPYSHSGTGLIDLRGTPFAVNDTFGHAGYLSAGTWAFSNNNQTVNLTGGGYCGWTAPTSVVNMEAVTAAGSFSLQLKYIGQ